MGTRPAGSVFREIHFVEKPEVQDEGGRHVAKRSSDPRDAYPEVNVQVRDLVRVVDIVAPPSPPPPLPRGGSVFRENSFHRSDKPKAVYPLSRTSKLEA